MKNRNLKLLSATFVSYGKCVEEHKISYQTSLRIGSQMPESVIDTMMMLEQG